MPQRLRRFLLLASLAAVFGYPMTSAANVIYTYTGALFTSAGISNVTPPDGTYTTSMRITGSFERATALPPNLLWVFWNSCG
jgi:hypothetical protein